MYIIYFSAIWIVTVLLASFTVVPIMIILFFGIPFTLKLRKEGALGGYQPIKNELISMIFLGFVFALYTWAILTFTSLGVAYIVGLGMVVLLSLGKVGNNPSNMADYLETNKRFIDQNKLEK